MKLLELSLDVKLNTLRKNPYFDNLPVTQEQLAAQLGTVREVIARSLKELERSGAIRIEDRRIHIADDTVLQQWSQPN